MKRKGGSHPLPGRGWRTKRAGLEPLIVYYITVNTAVTKHCPESYRK
jgi:hypothetical protein